VTKKTLWLVLRGLLVLWIVFLGGRGYEWMEMQKAMANAPQECKDIVDSRR
jgi:hypothetical protein